MTLKKSQFTVWENSWMMSCGPGGKAFLGRSFGYCQDMVPSTSQSWASFRTSSIGFKTSLRLPIASDGDSIIATKMQHQHLLSTKTNTQESVQILWTVAWNSSSTSSRLKCCEGSSKATQQQQQQATESDGTIAPALKSKVTSF